MNQQDANQLHELILSNALEVMKKKRVDYAPASDPFANLRRCEKLACPACGEKIPAWLGAMIRLEDKLSRLATLAGKGGVGAVSDESLVDTAVDAVNYIVITLCLILEATNTIPSLGPSSGDGSSGGAKPLRLVKPSDD